MEATTAPASDFTPQKPARRRRITAPGGLPKKAAAKKGASKKAAAPPSMPQKSKELDTKQLDPEKARSHLSRIYKLEREVETKKVAFVLASNARRAAKGALDEANDALEKEIREQRMGPGPLFNAEGDGPAVK